MSPLATVALYCFSLALLSFGLAMFIARWALNRKRKDEIELEPSGLAVMEGGPAGDVWFINTHRMSTAMARQYAEDIGSVLKAMREKDGRPRYIVPSPGPIFLHQTNPELVEQVCTAMDLARGVRAATDPVAEPTSAGSSS